MEKRTPLRADPSLMRRDRILFGALLLTYLILALIVGFGRPYLGYGVETDLIENFIPEARRFVSGQALLSQFHPPLYAMALGALHQGFYDWFTAGVAFSILSGLAVLTTSYLLFCDLAGRPAAWGAALTLLGSSLFLQFSASAVSDVVFLALFMGCCLCAVKALRYDSGWLWGGCGLVAGLAVLTRSNGLTLALWLLVPLLAPQAPLRSRIENVVWTAAGLAVPILVLLVYAMATGSSIWPSQNHLNLAMTYFAGEDRGSGDALEAIRERFHSMKDVLLYDPVFMIKTYLFDLYKLLSQGITRLVEPPLYFLFLPGLVFLFARRISAGLMALFIVFVAQLLLVNFKAFQPRFFLFLVPFIGAAIGEVSWRLLQAGETTGWRRTVAALLGLMFVATAGLAEVRAYRSLSEQTAELSQIVPVGARDIPEGSILLARKPHLSFYIRADDTKIPNLADLEQLHQYLSQNDSGRPTFVFYGEEERRFRPQYLSLQSTHTAPDWLVAVAESRSPGDWVLYRYASE